VPVRLLQQPGRQQRPQPGLLHPHPGTLLLRRLRGAAVASHCDRLMEQQ
jgi:hypothetical protein